MFINKTVMKFLIVSSSNVTPSMLLLTLSGENLQVVYLVQPSVVLMSLSNQSKEMLRLTVHAHFKSCIMAVSSTFCIRNK